MCNVPNTKHTKNPHKAHDTRTPHGTRCTKPDKQTIVSTVSVIGIFRNLTGEAKLIIDYTIQCTSVPHIFVIANISYVVLYQYVLCFNKYIRNIQLLNVHLCFDIKSHSNVCAIPSLYCSAYEKKVCFMWKISIFSMDHLEHISLFHENKNIKVS